jgi:hypothetical protein
MLEARKKRERISDPEMARVVLAGMMLDKHGKE